MPRVSTPGTVPETDGGTYRLLTGADMEPLAIRRTYPEARFVARACRARVDRDNTAVWGVLLHDAVPRTEVGAEEISTPVATDDGREYDALLADDGARAGDSAAILAAAKYWELPPAYIRSLPGGDDFAGNEG